MNIQRALAKSKWYIRHEKMQNVTYTDLVNILEAGIQHPIDPCEVPLHTHISIPIDLARRFIHADRFKWDEQWATLAEMEKVIKEQLDEKR